MTEGRNTGFRKIRNTLKGNGSPEPIATRRRRRIPRTGFFFKTNEERTYFSTTLYIHPDFRNDGVNIEDLSERESSVLEIIKSTPSLSAAKIALRLGVSRPTVERAIRSLKIKGLLIRRGSAKNGEWIIQTGK